MLKRHELRMTGFSWCVRKTSGVYFCAIEIVEEPGIVRRARND